MGQAGVTGAAGTGDPNTSGEAGTTGTAGTGEAGTTGTAGTGEAGTTGAAGTGEAGTTGAAGTGDAGTTGAAGTGDAAVPDAGGNDDGGAPDGGGADVPTTATIQINAGTTDVVPPFVADMLYVGGTGIKHVGTIDVTGVTNPAPAAVYHTARTGTATYTIPGFVAGSTHLVRLHFAETYWTLAAKRTFNVALNGTEVLSAFDVFATAGAQYKAVIREFIQPASAAGTYELKFTSIVDKALISGIEIY